MLDTTVKYFGSSMSGAPALSGSAGALIAVLDACLINGFGSITLDSLVIADNVATATKSTGHGFAMLGNTGPVIAISGASPAGLNAEWRIASVPNSTTFTFTTSGITNQTATGTIAAKRAGAGWEKAFSGTNKAAYRSLDLAGTRLYLRVDDSTTTYASVSGYETMSDVDTGSGAFNGGGTGRWYKSDAANASARGWRLFADSRCVYLFFNKGSVQSNYYIASFWFGDIIPNIPDAFGCGIVATDNNDYDYNLAFLAKTAGSQMARSYLQTGSAQAFYRNTFYPGYSYAMGYAGMPYPSPIGNELLAFPAYVLDASHYLRGEMPGLWAAIHNLSTASNDGLVVSDMQINGSLRDLMICAVRDNTNGYRVMMDLTGPWR